MSDDRPEFKSESGSLYRRLVRLTLHPKTLKYAAASAVSIIITQGLLILFYGILRRWSVTTSNIMATGIAAVPSYYMNRAWAWGKTGRSHFLKEVLPFWGLAFLGLGLSLLAVSYAHHLSVSMGLSHLSDVLFINVASLMAFGVLWVGKFVIFNKVLFVES